MSVSRPGPTRNSSALSGLHIHLRCFLNLKNKLGIETFPEEVNNFSFFQSNQSSSGTHSASPVVPVALLPEVTQMVMRMTPHLDPVR